MDSERFDALTRMLGLAVTRRGASAALATLAAMGPPLLEGEAKKKKKKTICHGGQTIKVAKKAVKAHLAHGDTIGPCPPPPPCRNAQQTCSNNCCSGLECGDNGCTAADVCFQNEGGPCPSGDDCDCNADLFCSERQNFTCQDCGFEHDLCSSDNDCCLNSLVCKPTLCIEGEEKGCCLDTQGAECFDECDCCLPLGCSERQGSTCQTCGYPKDSCASDDNCCLLGSTCGDNGCDPPTDVCCQTEGEFCFDDCECCADFFCNLEELACEAFPPREGVNRERKASITPIAGHQGGWHRRSGADDGGHRTAGRRDHHRRRHSG